MFFKTRKGPVIIAGPVPVFCVCAFTDLYYIIYLQLFEFFLKKERIIFCFFFQKLKRRETDMAAVMDLMTGGLLVIIGLVVWGFVYQALCTSVLSSSVLSLVALIPLVIAAGFIIRAFLAAFA